MRLTLGASTVLPEGLYLGLYSDCQALPCSAATGAGPASSGWTGFGLSSHQRSGLDVSLSPSSSSQLRSSVVRGRKWVQLPDASATSLPPARAQPGVTDGRWARHSLLLVVLWFLIFFPVKKTHKTKNQQKTHRKVESRACSSLHSSFLWLRAACTRVPPLLQIKTHHKIQEFKSLWTDKLNFPSLGKCLLQVTNPHPRVSQLKKNLKKQNKNKNKQKKLKENPENKPKQSRETGKGCYRKVRYKRGKKSLQTHKALQ